MKVDRFLRTDTQTDADTDADTDTHTNFLSLSESEQWQTGRENTGPKRDGCRMPQRDCFAAIQQAGQSCGLRDGKKREDYYVGINFIFFRDSFILWRKGIEGKMNSSLTHPTATTTNSPL
mgnify:CR=1 FL=1